MSEIKRLRAALKDAGNIEPAVKAALGENELVLPPLPRKHDVVSGSDNPDDFRLALEQTWQDLVEVHSIAKKIENSRKSLVGRCSLLKAEMDKQNKRRLTQKIEFVETIEDYKKGLRDTKAALKECERSFLERQGTLVAEHQKRTLDTRVRTEAMINERDRELQRLRGIISKVKRPKAPAGDADRAEGEGRGGQLLEENPLPNLGLRRGGESMKMTSAAPNILLSDLTDRREKENRAYRAQIRDLEAVASDAESRAILINEQCIALKGEIRRMERNVRREGANLEYLKNILLAYMSGEKDECPHTLLAISTILQFSKEERNKIQNKRRERAAGPSSSLGILSWWIPLR